MKNKSNSYSIGEIIGKIISAIKYIFGFFSNRKKKLDVKKIREYEGVLEDLDESYKKIDKKKNKKKKQNVEKRLNNMF